MNRIVGLACAVAERQRHAFFRFAQIIAERRHSRYIGGIWLVTPRQIW
ncbi:MAG TPA: hypothetical protein ACFCUC_00755 [Desulfobacterales bacterium]